MMYVDVVREFAQRTRTNLAAIDRLLADGHDVYETTQLVNSMLGLLVFPQQEYVDQIPRTPLAKLQSEGWPVPKVTAGFTQVGDLNQLIRYLRNSIANFNIRFIADDQQRHIKGLIVWNENAKGVKTWEAELSKEDLRGIADRFVDLLVGS